MAIVKMLDSDVTNKNTGRDLTINIERVRGNRGNTYPNVNSIMSNETSPISLDVELGESWVNDSKEWRDVYPVKGTDYLDIIVNNQTPSWDKKLEKFVPKVFETFTTDTNTSDSIEDEITVGGGNNVGIESAIDKTEDDLPF